MGDCGGNRDERGGSVSQWTVFRQQKISVHTSNRRIRKISQRDSSFASVAFLAVLPRFLLSFRGCSSASLSGSSVGKMGQPFNIDIITGGTEEAGMLRQVRIELSLKGRWIR